MSKWLRSMVSIGLVLAACLTASLPLPAASSAVSTTQMARLAGNGPALVSTLVNTAPVVDGTISEGEWANSVQITLNGFNNPGNTSTAELYIANTTTDLYIAMILSDSTMSSEEIAEINLDANNDGIATAGAEDALRYEGSSSPTSSGTAPVGQATPSRTALPRRLTQQARIATSSPNLCLATIPATSP